MIEKRHKTFVTTNGLIPVDSICNKIGLGKTVEALMQIFPKLSVDDIFEAVHFYADNTTIPQMDNEKLLKVENTGGVDDIVIEVTNLNQIVYIKLLSVGHSYYKEVNDFSRLMNQGLRIVTLENIESFEKNEILKDELGLVVNEAMQLAVPEIINDFDLTKKDLDYDEFLERKNNNETKI
tara:strand:+ start:1433 stop:1972 length:540 start_codon:yes stop_codon:yes gene_type:complete